MKSVIALIAIAAVAAAASDVVVLTKDTFASTIEAGPTLVEFYAPWCGHCKHLEPIYDKLATEVKGRGVTIAKVDCVDQKTLQAEYGIRGFPTIKLFKDGGKEVVDYRSARDVASFSAFLTEHATLAPPAKPHLRYFEARGRAELIRLILEEVGVAYEDTRLSHESWANEKPNTDRYTFGQMPQITVDGIELVQSGAIARYFARKHGLYGTDGTSATLVDVVYGGFEDLRAKYSTLVYDKDFESKRAEFSTKTLAVWLPHFERILERNAAGNNQFFVGSKLTFADAEAFDVLEPIYALDSKAFDAHPRLLAFLKAFATRPNIAAYLSSERRPAFAHGNFAYFYNPANPPTTVFKA